MTARWHAALGYALVAQDLGFVETAAPDPAAAVALLAEAGWDATAIREHAQAAIAEECVWPHPVPESLRAGCGAAQLHAATVTVRRLLDLQTLEVRPPTTRTRLNADEQRLMREVPPHHGH